MVGELVLHLMELPESPLVIRLGQVWVFRVLHVQEMEHLKDIILVMIEAGFCEVALEDVYVELS